MKNILLFVLAASMMAACNSSAEGEKKESAPKSEQIQKAEALHEEALALYNETKKIAVDAREKWEAEMADFSEDVTPEQMEKIETYGLNLKQVLIELDNWEKTLTEIPGHAHEHDHDHNHAHDHAHDHDHEKERILEGLTDEQHVEIQQEQLKYITKIRTILDRTLAEKN
jgi:ABC-type nickel/cobalt efflux system permease component RcnA